MRLAGRSLAEEETTFGFHVRQFCAKIHLMTEQECVCRALDAATPRKVESSHSGSSFEYLRDLDPSLTPTRYLLMDPAQKSCSNAWQGRFEGVKIESSAVRPKAFAF